MLKISIEENREVALRLVLEGRLIGPWVEVLRRVCEESRAAALGSQVVVDLCGLTSMDASGQALLSELFHHGAVLRCSDVLNQYLVEQMAGNSNCSQGACHPFESGQASDLASGGNQSANRNRL